jgi:hypothetical protein
MSANRGQSGRSPRRNNRPQRVPEFSTQGVRESVKMEWNAVQGLRHGDTPVK